MLFKTASLLLCQFIIDGQQCPCTVPKKAVWKIFRHSKFSSELRDNVVLFEEVSIQQNARNNFLLLLVNFPLKIST
jgi:hypothetical protein